MAVRYAYREGVRFPVKPQVVGDELARISVESGGVIKPAAVVDASRPLETPLHPCFEWDDYRAAELHREDTARSLIRSVRVVFEGDEDGVSKADPTPTYVHINTEEHGSGYVTTRVAMSDAEMKAQVLAEAVAYLRGWRNRYAHLKELAAVVEAIDRIQVAD